MATSLSRSGIGCYRRFPGCPTLSSPAPIAAQRAEAYEANRGRWRPHDQIWCVFDADQHPNIPEALALAAEHNIHVTLSNPCLEVWFLLHFGDQNGFIDRHAAQGKAEAVLRCPKSLSGAAVGTLIDRYEMAKPEPSGSTRNTRATAHLRGAIPGAGCGGSSTSSVRLKPWHEITTCQRRGPLDPHLLPGAGRVPRPLLRRRRARNGRRQ